MAATSSFIVDLNKSFGDSYTGVTGTMDFLFGDAGDSNANTYTLDLTIKNTSGAPITSSSITGFAFDTPTGVSAFTYNRNGTNFYKADDSLTISPAPFFTFCASTDNNINNGTNCGSGVVASGLANGQSATVKYAFNFAGTSPEVGDVSNAFFNLFDGLVLATPLNQNKVVNNTVVLAARFQGINSATENGGSDKVTGKPQTKPDGGPGDAVPGPLPVLGAAAAFVQSRRLRRRLAAARSAQQNPG
ncbi:hypothetical protein [Synechococcus sp. CS-1332]|uniref:hypothetical protein n=1 Tax=Synechococcus sp. CS-1332 TaxID=2847972 RepID=UPI00223AE367|nr:hypothetical protein [Synechococcus sp. CS-1332]